jgi:hypothetical protein
MVFAAGIVVPSLAWLDFASFVDTAVLALGVAFVGAAAAAGFSIVVLAGVAFCWAKAVIGRIARVIAASRLEMRVMVGVLCTGGSMVAPG